MKSDKSDASDWPDSPARPNRAGEREFQWELLYPKQLPSFAASIRSIFEGPA